MSDSKVRDAFAAHMDRIHGTVYRDRYLMCEWWEDPAHSDEWQAWQASRAAALEEAERLCRAAAERFAYRTLASTLARNLADGIRDLAAKEVL